MNEFLSYGKQWIDEDDINAVIDALKSDYLTQGPRITEFENAFAQYVDAKYAVAVSSGTAALHIAVQALDIPKGKTGITSPITFAASANCFLYNGLQPSFADIDPKTYCIDSEELKKNLTDDTAVIIPVHFAGQPCDMERIKGIAQGNPNVNRYIIEDASHAIGSKYENGKKVGSCCYSDMTIFSFHPVKTIATGEGGLITTNDKDLYEKLLLLRTHGITKDPSKFKITDPDLIGPWYYEMQELGFNYRITDIQAALGLNQLKKIDNFIRRRRDIVSTYNTSLANIDGLTIPFEHKNVFSAFHLYVIEIDFKRLGKTRTQAMNELKSKNIGTQVHYIPVHLLPYYRENFGYKPGDFPKSEEYYSQCLSIPLYPRMTDQDIQRVITATKELLNH